MATKLSEAMLSRIEGLLGIKIKTKTEEEARPKLVDFLATQEVNGVEDDPIQELVEMAEVFADEVPAAKAAAPTKLKKVVDEPEDEEEELDAAIGDGDDDEEEEEEPEPEEEEEEEAPAKPTKKAVAPAAKATVKPAVKATPKEKEKTGRESLPGEKFDARNNKKHEVYLKPFKEFFPAEDFEITLLKQGFTVRVLGKNAKTTILNFDELKIDDGKLIGNVYTNRFKSVEDLMETLPEEYHEKKIGMFRMESHPSIRSVSQDELFDIFENSELVRLSLDRANAKDVKMGINREKLEETLNAGTKATAKPAAKPAAKVVAKKK
jgi:hypothetical protein